MRSLATDAPAESPVEVVIQPCSEACAGFKRLDGDGWSDYGVCTNPRSPYHGCPVRIGRDCPDYQPAGAT